MKPKYASENAKIYLQSSLKERRKILYREREKGPSMLGKGREEPHDGRK